MHTAKTIVLAMLGACLIWCCKKTSDIDIKPPDYNKEMVVEGYVQAGDSLKLLISESASYFEKPELTLVYNAIVTLTYKGITDTLKNVVTIDKIHKRGFNYISNIVIPEDYDAEFSLHIQDISGGRGGSAKTKLVKQVPIEILRKVDAGNGLFNLNVAFEDDPANRDYYRLLLFSDSLHRQPDVDLLLTDELYASQRISITPQMPYSLNDTVIVELYHLDPSFYKYLESMRNAIVANFDPLTRPTSVKSNIEGAIGIFSSARVSRDTLIIK